MGNALEKLALNSTGKVTTWTSVLASIPTIATIKDILATAGIKT